jgi:Kef-type K+ transport system membrane component KefB
MSLSTPDVARILLALVLLVGAAHLLGSLFARYRQPRVIGEILGGLLLGPTVLGGLMPGAERYLFPAHGATATVLAAVAELGLLLLLFCSGAEIRTAFSRDEARTVSFATLSGLVLPFLVGLGMVALVDEHRYWGPLGNHTSFTLVFAISMAVTSIPVISKIMIDLGLMGTRFSRIVLGVAVIEDVVLYVVLAIALGAVGKTSGALFGVPRALGIAPGSGLDLAYHCIVTVAFLVVSITAGPAAYRRLAGSKLNVISSYSPVAFQLLTMLAGCLACAFLGIEVFFGAFVTGIVVGRSASPAVTESDAPTFGAREAARARDAIRDFSFAFFIPIYFALVGLTLNLRHGFPIVFFVAFLVVACGVKAASVYVGARAAGERPRMATHLAVAMNARGGPGIVIASTAFAAKIIGRPFYGVLVLLAVLTSLVAGAWLDRVPRSEFSSPDAGSSPAGHRNELRT